MDGGEAAYSGPRFYASFGGPIDMTAWLVERLVAAPNRTLDLLPGGQARAEKLTTLEVGEGTARQTITAWGVSGLSNAPTPVWTDASGVFFGSRGARVASDRIRIGAGGDGEGAERRPRDACPRLSTATGPHADEGRRLHQRPAYDAPAVAFLADHTVVVEQGPHRRRRPLGSDKGAAGGRAD